MSLGYGCQITRFLRDGATGDRASDYYKIHHKIHLDTGAWMSGVFGCFRVEDCRSFYVGK